MAINPAHVSVAANGDIRWTGAAETYTVLELHRFLQDLADDPQASGDDLVDITSPTPSERSTDNIITLLGTYNIDATMAQHLYDGSITQGAAGAEVYSGLVVVGTVNLATTLMIISDDALYDDGVHTPATPFWGSGLNADAANNVLMRCLVKTRTAGADIDGKKIRVQAREYLDTYAEFSVTMGLGNSVAAIFTNDDLNNTTVEATVATWTTVSNVEGYQTIDLNNGNGAQPYYSQWNRDTYTINQLYERAKWLTRRGATTTDLHAKDGELFRGITHEIVVDTPTGTFASSEEVSWTGGTGLMLAINSTTAPTKMWIQLLTGSAPTDGLTITGVSTATADVDTTITSRSISPCFLGQSTGTAIIGAYGIGIESADLTVADKLFDLNNAPQSPPNNVTFTVAGLVASEDAVLVGPKAAGNDFAFNQMTLATALTGATETAVEVQAASIPVDTPQTGFLRIELASGIKRRVAYTSWTSATFTIASTNFTGDTAAISNEVMLGYIDKVAAATSESFTLVYNADRDLFIRVRDGGVSPIKTFETPGVLGSGGGSTTAIRTSDL